MGRAVLAAVSHVTAKANRMLPVRPLLVYPEEVTRCAVSVSRNQGRSRAQSSQSHARHLESDTVHELTRALE